MIRRRIVDPGRRRFCFDAIAGGLGAAGLAAVGFPWICRTEAAPADLAAVQGASAAATRRAVEIIGGMGRFVRPGQRVVVKPNIGFDRVPEQAANTSPEVVAEVVRLALEAGAREVSVFDRTSNESKQCYRASGTEAAVLSVGNPRAKVFIPDPSRYVRVAIRGEAALADWTFYEDAVRADVFINCPVAKHHVTTGLSMGMKNLMGVNRGGPVLDT